MVVSFVFLELLDSSQPVICLMLCSVCGGTCLESQGIETGFQQIASLRLLVLSGPMSEA